MKNLLKLDAKHYALNSNFQYSQAKDLLGLVNFQHNASVLDVGCGHGHIIAEISQMIPDGDAVGIDASKQMISFAKERFKSEVYRNLKFFHMKAEDMHFAKDSFDLIICTNVLMWIRKPKKALEIMITSLKKGGNLVIITYPTDTPYAILFEEVLNELFPHLRKKSALETMLSPNQYKRIFEINELKMLCFDIEDTTFIYEDWNDFKNYVKGWLVCYAPLTECQQEEFLTALCQKVREKGYFIPKTPIAIPHQTLKIISKKP